MLSLHMSIDFIWSTNTNSIIKNEENHEFYRKPDVHSMGYSEMRY